MALTLVCQAVLNVIQWKLNRVQGQFNREVLAMFARLRARREVRDALERLDQMARDAAGGGR